MTQYITTPYTPIPFSDLKRRSHILASGIEGILPQLPEMEYYGSTAGPCVKWVYLPKDNRYDPEIDVDGDNSVFLRHQIADLFPSLSVAQFQGPLSNFFWIWEQGRPTVASIEARLPAMYLLGGAIDCCLEGWAFSDHAAWEYGLSKFIEASGFDSETIRPGDS